MTKTFIGFTHPSDQSCNMAKTRQRCFLASLQRAFSRSDYISNCDHLIAIWKRNLMLFLMTTVSKSLNPSNKGVHTFYKK